MLTVHYHARHLSSFLVGVSSYRSGAKKQCRYCANTKRLRSCRSRPAGIPVCPRPATIAELETPALDRFTVKGFPGLSRRQVIRLMAQMQPAQSARHGIAIILKRELLLERLVARRPVHSSVQGTLRRRETFLAGLVPIANVSYP